MFTHTYNERPIFPALSKPFLFLFPFLATALYSLSFLTIGHTATLLPWAICIGIAAAVSWLCFGGLLVAREQLPLNKLFAICLEVMFRGNLVLLVSVVVNLLAAHLRLPLAILAGMHGCILLIANVVMARTFCRLGPTANLSPARSFVYWTFAQNGIFAIILMVMLQLWRKL